ncbi:MAG: DNA repair exonuclease [Candidatus Diapherotrites archaeon]|nr:DNA repair exonuclease [Candidatus Diapherotrites archaeon]
MKIAIASDMHFGYAWGTERQEDSFVQGREAIAKCLDADAIILPGDIFDSRVPKPEVMDKAMRVLRLVHSSHSPAAITGFRSGREVPASMGTPVVAIHGTHERRARGLTNPVQLLEAAGLCVAAHNDAVIISRQGESVAIHGMGGVPEQYAPLALKECSFKPLPGAVNILVLHQSFREYVYEDAAFLSMGDLPDGFDLYINGHVHTGDVKQKDGKTLLHPGSTIITQMIKSESEHPKRVWFYDTATGELSSESLDTPRKLYCLELKATGDAAETVRKARELLEGIRPHNPHPLVKLKVTGSLPPGSFLSTADITRGFDSLVISVDSTAESEHFKKKIEILREAQAKKSIDEIGLSILEKNLEQAGYSGPRAPDLLPLLVEGKEEEARKIISGQTS